MNCVERSKQVAALVAVQLGLALVQVLFKKALDGGVDHLIIVAYRQSISGISMIPFVCFWERSSWAKLTAGLIGQMFLCALLGMTLAQYLYLVGLDYTTATITCAFINMVPVITFFLTLLLRMEKVNMKNRSGKAKVFGTLTCVIGALILSLYKGMPLINHRQPSPVLNHKRPKGIGLGAAFLSAGSLAWCSWFLIQYKIGQKFPYQYSSTSMVCLFSGIQSAILSFIIDRKISRWNLRGELQILSVIYAGVVGSGLCYVIMSWCVKKRGPVFTSAFSPLIQTFAAVFDVSLLHEEIYLGSIIGSLVVVVGMYILLWGKSNDEETWNGIPKRTEGHNGQESAHDQFAS